jgi:hypothetical protein
LIVINAIGMHIKNITICSAQVFEVCTYPVANTTEKNANAVAIMDTMISVPAIMWNNNEFILTFIIINLKMESEIHHSPKCL